MQLTADESTSRVTLTLTTQDWSVLLDPDGDGDDLLLGLLGFTTAQASRHAAALPMNNVLPGGVKSFLASLRNVGRGRMDYSHARDDGVVHAGAANTDRAVEE